MQKRKVKPITYVLTSLAGIFTVIVGFPAIAGVLDYVVGEGDAPEVSSIIGLAILSAALGAVVLWFAGGRSTNKTEQHSRDLNEYWGKSLIFAAFCFTIFSFLSPMLGSENITGIPMWDTLIKWVAGISLMAGSIFLVVTVCYGMIFIWFKKL